MQTRIERSDSGWRRVVLAGLAGGLAEIAWVAAWCALQGSDGWQVARAVTAALAPALGAVPFAAALGLVVHFGLSVLLAVAFVRAAAWAPRRVPTLALALAALAGVWAVNFFLVLPALDPAFVRLLPYPVTLASKLLFGAAMALALTRFEPASRTAAVVP